VTLLALVERAHRNLLLEELGIIQTVISYGYS
jgi:hypothetical protein